MFVEVIIETSIEQVPGTDYPILAGKGNLRSSLETRREVVYLQ
jgi:hypothetical protein